MYEGYFLIQHLETRNIVKTSLQEVEASQDEVRTSSGVITDVHILPNLHPLRVASSQYDLYDPILIFFFREYDKNQKVMNIESR